ncbi:hypothetical protein H0H93_010438 [Arthromyces matolae]|nr:hypothetical protein H0H93_010438 [Arthromyces matolae]
MMKIVDESDSQSTTPSLASSSTISIESTLTSSTTLTRSTVPGPGALSGKAILALGKFTLRGAEFVIIRRRLNVLSSKFPLKDDSTIKGIDGMYGDLLELSRLNMYSNNIREKAFQILLAQISLRETRYLIESLCAWPDVEIQIFLTEVMSLFDPIRTISPSILYDICIDLLELSGSETMDMEIRIRALRSLHRVSTRGNVGAQDIIRDYLDLQVTEHSVRVISQVIKSLSRLISTNTPESKFFYLKWDHRDFVINAVPHLIHLFMNLAKYSDKVLTIFVASDVLGILRPFLEMELRGDDSSKRIAVHQDDLLTVYDQSDYSLLDQIKEQGLEALLKPLPEGTGNAFGYRRMLLCRAFNVFLGRGDDREFPELWSMDWDDLPSGLDGSDYAALWINS